MEELAKAVKTGGDERPSPWDKILGGLTVAATGTTAMGLTGPKEWSEAAQTVGVPFVLMLLLYFTGRWCLHHLAKPLVATHNKFVIAQEKVSERNAISLESLAECQSIQSEALVGIKGALEEIRKDAERRDERDLKRDEIMQQVAADLRETTKLLKQSK